ncbi:MAG: tRNA uridine-5-carboxymethylaminomethyl(34) synthesis enzyme MnmG [Patescibacteria group bacterium]
MDFSYEIIVVGGGHAGCEACLASARMGAKTLLISGNLDRIAWASCNPSIGGPGKSQIVRELDALGGEMAKNTDKTYIQIKNLNESRGTAVQALRAQIDKIEYSFEMKKTLENQKNLDLINSEVQEILLDKSGKVSGVRTDYGITYSCKSLVITTGTFLNGKILAGKWSENAGRMGDRPSNSLTNSFINFGLKVGRLKTGTPPRIAGNTIDWSKTEIQAGSETPLWFSFLNEIKNHKNNQQDIPINFPKPQLPCYLIYTNKKTHDIILSAKENLPLFDGTIQSIGPRYCPSFESKVVNFSDKPRHPFFLEPEGIHTNEIYVQGANTSVPWQIQEKFIHSIPALENAKIVRYGYAVEYDFVFPSELKSSLETKKIPGLFLAGQINGTTGYEEAAGQGLVAGINAVKFLKNEKPFIMNRTDGFIGVMIDDLITQEYREPYRMFTARSEFRLKFRQSNSDFRLSKLGFELGLINKEEFELLKEKWQIIDEKVKILKNLTLENILQKKENSSLKDSHLNINNQIAKTQFIVSEKNKKIKIENLIKEGKSFEEIFENRKDILQDISTGIISADTEIWARIFYEGYLQKEEKYAKKMLELQKIKLPENFDYDSVPSIRKEARERLKEIQPENLDQASRISGVMNADLSILSIWIQKLRLEKKEKKYNIPKKEQRNQEKKIKNERNKK